MRLTARLCLMAVLLSATAVTAVHAAVPNDEAIRAILRDRIDVRKQGVGIVVGIIEPSGRRIVAYGKADRDGVRRLDGDTVFEIGSMSKVFTSLLLADMIEKGEVQLDDPIDKYLPKEVRAPQRNGRSITLIDLATHTSSLPRMPANFFPTNPSNPYADYSRNQLYEFISNYQLTRDIGSEYEYSNLAVGLLGTLLELRTKQDYESLVVSRIAAPLKMKDTRVVLTEEMKRRLASGFDQSLQPVANWDLPTLAGAGALRSTANDLLKFLAVYLGYADSPLRKPMNATLAVRRPMNDQTDIALGWHVRKSSIPELIWHNGGTGGYRTFFGFDPKNRVGIVVLANTALAAGYDDIGFHLLNTSIPLANRPIEHQEVKLDPKEFDKLVGRYEMAPNVFFNVTKEGDRLFGESQGTKGELTPESSLKYFSKYIDMQFEFSMDPDGQVTGVSISRSGGTRVAKRVAGLVATQASKEIEVGEEALERLVGLYELAPSFILNVTREGKQLMVQATGQAKFPVFAHTETEFFYKIVEAQLSFEIAGAQATAVTLHQNGRHLRAKRTN